MKMRNKKLFRLRFLFRLLHRNQATLVDALAQHIEIATLENIVLGGEDWRTLVSRSAAHLEISEERLLELLARTMRIPFLRRVTAFDPLVGEGVPDIKTLLQHAMIPVVTEGIVSGYACVDPGRAERILGETSGCHLYIAEWNKVKDALEETERIFAEEQERLQESKKIEVRQCVLLTLLQLIEVAESHRSDSVCIRIAEGKVNYEFRIPDGKKGTGTISETLCPELLQLLNETAQTQAFLLLSSDRNATVEVVSPNECFLIQPVNLVEGSGPHEEPAFATSCSILTPEPAYADSGALRLIGECKILIVEDNCSFQSVLRCYFQKQNMNVTFASNGIEAYEKIREGMQPDIVLCDVHMPAMNGREFIHRLRQVAGMECLPVIMLTSDQDIETELLFIAYGVEAFLRKSDDPRLLLGHIERIIKRRFCEVDPVQSRAA